jgi:hypothetical protein
VLICYSGDKYDDSYEHVYLEIPVLSRKMNKIQLQSHMTSVAYDLLMLGGGGKTRTMI